MVLGMSLATYTTVHVIISLIGIASGFIVLFGLLTGRLLGAWNGLFLVTTALTSVTGFGFPNTKVTPGIIVGILSLIVLAIAIFALYARHLSGAWRRTYVIAAMIALYFNVFVLIAHHCRCEKVSAGAGLAGNSGHIRSLGGTYEPLSCLPLGLTGARYKLRSEHLGIAKCSQGASFSNGCTTPDYCAA
jgi:hypothetical protein